MIHPSVLSCLSKVASQVIYVPVVRAKTNTGYYVKLNLKTLPGLFIIMKNCALCIDPLFQQCVRWHLILPYSAFCHFGIWNLKVSKVMRSASSCFYTWMEWWYWGNCFSHHQWRSDRRSRSNIFLWPFKMSIIACTLHKTLQIVDKVYKVVLSP